MNARFWVWWNDGFVKLTLKPGQRVELFTGGKCQEGYSCSAEVYSHDGDRVLCELTCWGRDCDGRYERRCDSYCPLDRLKSYVDGEGPDRPEWLAGESSQWDQYAEMAGY